MTPANGALGTHKRLLLYIMPSWVSGSLAIGVGVVVVGGTILLTHVGGDVQQSLTGIHNVYSESSIGASVQTVADNFARNTYLNNALLFLLWGSVGIVVYSIVQGIAREVRGADDLVHELNYVHADKNKILRSAVMRAGLRLGALIVWWLLFYWLAYKLIPYTIAASHVTAVHPTDMHDWIRCLLAGLACMLCVQILAVLLRLITLRIRVLTSTLVV